MASYPVRIAGGGIAGLASALGLARIGREARLLEQAAAFETVGAGLQVGPNAVRALKYLDAWDAVAPASFAPPAIVIRDGHNGRVLQRIPLDGFERRFGEPYRVIHRADLLAGLLERARSHPGIALATGARVKGFADRGGHVEVETEAAAILGEALLGADGIRSAIRDELVADGAPVRHPESLFRALAPIDAGTDRRLAAITLWLCRGGHVVHYPVQGGTALNLVVAALDARWSGEGWSLPASSPEVLAHFPDMHEDLRDVLALPSGWLKWAAASRAPASTWSRGRVTLVGDAAHAALPYLAQGAAMALEDAATLSVCLERNDAVAAAFGAYQVLRMPRTGRIVRESRKLGDIYHAGGPLRLARNLVLRMTDPVSFLKRLAWVYDFDPLAV